MKLNDKLFVKGVRKAFFGCLLGGGSRHTPNESIIEAMTHLLDLATMSCSPCSEASLACLDLLS